MIERSENHALPGAPPPPEITTPKSRKRKDRDTVPAGNAHPTKNAKSKLRSKVNDSEDKADGTKLVAEIKQQILSIALDTEDSLNTLNKQLIDKIAPFAKGLAVNDADKSVLWGSIDQKHQKHLTDAIKCCAQFLEKITPLERELRKVKDKKVDIACIIKSKEKMYHGLKAILDNNLDRARALFMSASVYYPNTLAQFFLAVTFYRQGNYNAASQIFYYLINAKEIDNKIVRLPSDIYCIYSQLSEDEMHDGNPSFIEVIYNHSEFYYYLALSKKELGEPYKKYLAEAYVRRGDNCFYKGYIGNAYRNYELALRESPGYGFAHFRMGVCLFAMGKVGKMRVAFKLCIDRSEDPQEKMHYYSRIIVLEEEAGCIDRTRFIVNQLVKSDSPAHHCIALFYQVKLAVLSPQVTCWEEIQDYYNQILQLYLKQNYEAEKEQLYELLYKANALMLDYFLKASSSSTDPISFINIINYLMESNDRLFSDIYKHRVSTLRFDNWIFQRLYVSYVSALFHIYFSLNLWANHRDNELDQLKRVSVKFLLTKLRTRLIFKRSILDSGIISASAGTHLESMKTMLDTFVSEKGEIGRHKKQEEGMSSYKLLLPEMETTSHDFSKNIKECYQRSVNLDKIKLDDLTIIRIKDKIAYEDAILFQYKSADEDCHHYLYLKFVLLVMSALIFMEQKESSVSAETEVKSETQPAEIGLIDKKHASLKKYHEKFRLQLEQFVDDIFQYKTLIRESKEENPISYQYKFSKMVFFEKKCYIFIARIFLRCVESNIANELSVSKYSLLKECGDYLAKHKQLESENIHSTVTLEDSWDQYGSQYEYIDMQVRVSDLNSESIRSRYEEQHQNLANDTLAVLYGKKRPKDDRSEKLPLIVPFPYHELTSGAVEVRERFKVRKKANISIHGITFIYSNPNYVLSEESKELTPTRKPFSRPLKQQVFLPITASQELHEQDEDSNEPKLHDILSFDKTSSPESKARESSILKRMQSGWDAVAAKGINHFPFFTKPLKPRPVNFNVRNNHSEQLFFVHLAKIEIEQLLTELKKRHPSFTDQSIVHMIAFDMYSDNTSCHFCKLSEIAEQQIESNGSFVGRLFNHLKSRSGQKPIKAVTRVSARSKYVKSSKNPKDKNIKYSNNLSIFENVEPIPITSGKLGK